MELVKIKIGEKTTMCYPYEKDTLYLCDPLLNTDCKKTNCYKKCGECYLTRKPAYAKAVKDKDER